FLLFLLLQRTLSLFRRAQSFFQFCDSRLQFFAFSDQIFVSDGLAHLALHAARLALCAGHRPVSDWWSTAFLHVLNFVSDAISFDHHSSSSSTASRSVSRTRSRTSSLRSASFCS